MEVLGHSCPFLISEVLEDDKNKAELLSGEKHCIHSACSDFGGFLLTGLTASLGFLPDPTVGTVIVTASY